jgi:hypothetical protein
MASHAAKVPAPAQRYFDAIGVSTHGRSDHPVISMTFRPETGWRRYPIHKRVSMSVVRRLRADGVTHVQLRAAGHAADFSVAELMRGPAVPAIS